jgi:beta-galactosidase
MNNIKRFTPISIKCPHILHGGDYNPEHWLNTPEIWDEDMRLMQVTKCNAMTLGIFSWSSIESKEGDFQFEWLDKIMDKLSNNGMFAVLATPSGSKPAWLSEMYPEVCRVNAQGIREKHQKRHNHCRTSPLFREKCGIINTHLANRYKNHPALIVWHVSNEYNGEPCHCDLCYEAFRVWLKQKYISLENLNNAWWAQFWSHTFTDWNQIRPLDESIHGLMLDWKRFNSDQTINFFKEECESLRQITPKVPITTNFVGISNTLDYWKFAQEVDVVSWDSYPDYHDRPDDWLNAVKTSFLHDLNRSFKKKPFMLMECSPSVTNWKTVNKLKRPGLHILECLQCIAHGGDTIQYFQWRKGRGGREKFHGGVVDHFPNEQSRVFREIASLGKILASLDDIVGTTTPAEVAILFDWENYWAIDNSSGPRQDYKNYEQTCVEHYRSFWSAGVPCDIVCEDSDFVGYKLLIAPMLYMIRPGVAERIQEFVSQGGTFVTTYLTGMVNENDLCFQNGFPGPLRNLLGIWAEEIDVLYDNESVKIVSTLDNNVGLKGTYTSEIYCELIHAETAIVLANYGSEFYAGRPAATVNYVGKGRAFYIASRNESRFQSDFYQFLIKDLSLKRVLEVDLPTGVTAQIRTDGTKEYIFILGFNREIISIDFKLSKYRNRLNGDVLSGKINLPGYTAMILEKEL